VVARRMPSYTREQLSQVRDMFRQEAMGIAQIAKETRIDPTDRLPDQR
jgi:hypothetical protein